jgi:hypothetical protein
MSIYCLIKVVGQQNDCVSKEYQSKQTISLLVQYSFQTRTTCDQFLGLSTAVMHTCSVLSNVRSKKSQDKNCRPGRKPQNTNMLLGSPPSLTRKVSREQQHNYHPFPRDIKYLSFGQPLSFSSLSLVLKAVDIGATLVHTHRMSIYWIE